MIYDFENILIKLSLFEYRSIILIILIGLIFTYINRYLVTETVIINYLKLGTIVHELAHALVCIILGGRIIDFDLTPTKENNKITLGYVETYSSIRIMPFIATAPLFVNFFLVMIMLEYFGKNDNNFFMFNDIESFILTYISTTLLIGAKLSSVDLRMYFKTFFTLYNMIIVSILIYLLSKYKLEFFIWFNNFLNQFQNVFFNCVLFLLMSALLFFFIKILTKLFKKNK